MRLVFIVPCSKCFTPNNTYAPRCYVLAGGTSKPLLLSIQRAACDWGPEDYSAAGLAELAWALAACGQPLSDGCRQLLRAALGCAAHRDDSEAQPGGAHPEQQVPPEGEQQAAADQDGGASPQQEQQQQQQQQPPRDWAAWFQGTPASRVVLLLWAAAQLDCRPCPACLAAAVKTLARDTGLYKLPTKVGGGLLC